MKVYLSIPISGRDMEQVKAELLEAAKAVAATGNEPVSPLDGVEDYTLPWIEYIIADLRILSQCQAVCMIGQCDKSPGCMVERIAAQRMGLQMIKYNPESWKTLPKDKSLFSSDKDGLPVTNRFLGGKHITAGVSREGKSVVVQRIHGVPSIVLHRGNDHCSAVNEESYVDAVPLSSIIYLLNIFPNLVDRV